MRQPGRNQIALCTGVKISDSVFNFGGIQYQQKSPRCSPPAAGFMEFRNIVLEASDYPLLDIVGDSNANQDHGLAVPLKDWTRNRSQARQAVISA